MDAMLDEVTVDSDRVLDTLLSIVCVLDAENRLTYVNSAAETFFDSGKAVLCGLPMTEILPEDSSLLSLIEQARAAQSPFAEHGMQIHFKKQDKLECSVHVRPYDRKGAMTVHLQPHSMVQKIGAQMNHRYAARSVSAMAAMLAHEIKNPLSGIRGAAQLLEQGVSEADKNLTGLICTEADRIVSLVQQMESFSDDRPLQKEPVNIHAVLEHVERVAHAGFASDCLFTERYDPSLPPVLGNKDMLIQVFLNLIKNAAEACGPQGEISLKTSYMPGIRMSMSGQDAPVHLPLAVTIEDNGPGIPEEILPHLFDPFVTTKPSGRGLGLALVAKIVNDHGGMIELDQDNGKTAFTILLPRAVET